MSTRLCTGFLLDANAARLRGLSEIGTFKPAAPNLNSNPLHIFTLLGYPLPKALRKAFGFRFQKLSPKAWKDSSVKCQAPWPLKMLRLTL